MSGRGAGSTERTICCMQPIPKYDPTLTGGVALLDFFTPSDGWGSVGRPLIVKATHSLTLGARMVRAQSRIDFFTPS